MELLTNYTSVITIEGLRTLGAAIGGVSWQTGRTNGQCVGDNEHEHQASVSR